jgi:hypothetical protein
MLYDENVDVAVVVVVEERASGAADLDEIELAGHPVEVNVVDAQFPGPVDKQLSGRQRRGVPRIGRRAVSGLLAAHARQQRDEQQEQCGGEIREIRVGCRPCGFAARGVLHRCFPQTHRARRPASQIRYRTGSADAASRCGSIEIARLSADRPAAAERSATNTAI